MERSVSPTGPPVTKSTEILLVDRSLLRVLRPIYSDGDSFARAFPRCAAIVAPENAVASSRIPRAIGLRNGDDVCAVLQAVRRGRPCCAIVAADIDRAVWMVQACDDSRA